MRTTKNTKHKSLKESEYEDFDYSNELRAIEDGGWEEMYPEDYKDSQVADWVRKAAQSRGMSDLEYINQEDFFDELIDSDPQDGPYIVDIEERKGYSEFLMDENGNPDLVDAREIFDKLMSGEYKGSYGHDCTGKPYDSLDSVIEGYDQEVFDSMIGVDTLKEAIHFLSKYKDNPKLPKTKKYYDACVYYQKQINDIATSFGFDNFYVDIPGEIAESRKVSKKNIKESANESALYKLCGNIERSIMRAARTGGIPSGVRYKWIDCNLPYDSDYVIFIYESQIASPDEIIAAIEPMLKGWVEAVKNEGALGIKLVAYKRGHTNESKSVIVGESETNEDFDVDSFLQSVSDATCLFDTYAIEQFKQRMDQSDLDCLKDLYEKENNPEYSDPGCLAEIDQAVADIVLGKWIEK